MSKTIETSVPKPVVAVVDDDPAVCGSLKFSLELEGFSVRAYRSGSELLQADNLEACDCFVIDQKMPDLTGMQLIENLRRRANFGAGHSRRRSPDRRTRCTGS